MSSANECPKCARPLATAGQCQACKDDRKSRLQTVAAAVGKALVAVGGIVIVLKRRP
jgi:hypothetical protein